MTDNGSCTGRNWTDRAVRDFVKTKCGALKNLSDTALDDVIASARIADFPAGTQIATREDKRSETVVILSGVLRTYSISPDGREYRISVQEAGDVHGVLSCVDGDVSPHDAVTDTDMSALVIGVASFKRLMSEHEDFREAILQVLCGRLRQSFAMLDNFAIGSPRLRLANCLVELAASHGSRLAQGQMVELQITQDSLGAMIGLSRQRTNIHLKAFEREGLISLGGGRLVIIDPQELMNMAG